MKKKVEQAVEEQFVPEGDEIEKVLEDVKLESDPVVTEFELQAAHLQIISLVVIEAMAKYPKVGMKWGHIRHLSKDVDPEGTILEGMKFKLLFPRTFNMQSGDTWTYWYVSTTAIKAFEAARE